MLKSLISLLFVFFTNQQFLLPPTQSPTTAHTFDNNGFGEGRLEEIAGLKVYIAGNRSSSRAILLGSDAFGYEGVILRNLTDKIAALGYLALLPDFFFGDPMDDSAPLEVQSQWTGRHPPEEGCENARKIIAELKARGVSVVGAAGFCWGGTMAVHLAKYYDTKAVVILHPGPISDDEINAVRVPIAILGAQFDELCPPEEVIHLAEILSAKPEVDSFMKVYPGVSHGWASRYNVSDAFAVKMANEADKDMLNWLSKYVK